MDARKQRLVNLIPRLVAWAEAGDIFTDVGRDRWRKVQRWMERCGLVRDWSEAWR